MWLSILSWFLGITLGLTLLFYSLFKYYTGNKGFWPKHNVPFVDFDLILSWWDRVSFKVPFHEMEKMMYDGFKKQGIRSFGGVMEWRKPVFYLMDLDLVKAVTVKDFDHFVNRREFMQFGVDNFSKDFLLNKEDQDWKDLRSTLSPTFTTGKIKRMFEVYNESADKMSIFLENEIGKEDGIDIRDCMIRYTMDVIASTAFGVDSLMFKDKKTPFATMLTRLQNPFKGWKVIKLFIAMLCPKLLSVLRITLTDKEALDFYMGVFQQTIKQREESGERRNDFVQLLIDAKKGELKDDDGNKIIAKSGKAPLTDQIILSQALLFFFAGFDTVETLLVFAAYELALNPEVQEQLFEEIDEVMTENRGQLGYEALNKMEYLDKVVSETLRKYPPAIRTERRCTHDYKIPNSDFILKKDTLVIIPMYGIHHDEEYYPEPSRFDPERFSPEGKAGRHQYAYFPFGTGPRNCIAMRFALMEGKTAVARLVHQFKIEPSRKTCIPLKTGKASVFKPDPDEGLWLKLTKRSSVEP